MSSVLLHFRQFPCNDAFHGYCSLLFAIRLPPNSSSSTHTLVYPIFPQLFSIAASCVSSVSIVSYIGISSRASNVKFHVSIALGERSSALNFGDDWVYQVVEQSRRALRAAGGPSKNPEAVHFSAVRREHNVITRSDPCTPAVHP